MFKRAFVEREVINTKVVNNLRKNGLKILPLEKYKKNKTPQLLVLKKKSPWIIKCPCSPGCVSCGYYILDFSENCILGCEYCFLNTYLNKKDVILYANIEDIDQELREFFKTKEWMRLGTGEFTDSLLLENITSINTFLWEIISKYPIILELKTKLDNIKFLEKLPEKARENLIISWTVNTEYVSQKFEYNSMQKRFKAIKKAIDQGFKIGLHFDPIIVYESFLDDYLKLIELLSQKINVSKICWISLGMLRMKGEKYLNMRKGFDNKLRYYKDVREYTYKIIYQKMKETFPYSVIYLCMENNQMWKEILNYKSYSRDEVNERFLAYFIRA